MSAAALLPLAQVRARVVPGAPLPFAIRDADGRLLLAKGQSLASEAQLEALLERGARVDASEARGPDAAVREASRAALPGLWDDAVERMGRALRQADAAPQRAFLQALDEAAAPVLALIERDPDLALFQVLRQQSGTEGQYGVRRAVHVATASHLGARRLGATEAEARRAFRAGLTLNLSLLELQGQLARQLGPLLPQQRELVASHGARSRALLEAQGVQDADWLQAVGEHQRAAQAGDLAQLVEGAKVFTAKFAPRAGREAMASDTAARSFFAGRQQQPAAAALLKEFGLYPPGTSVRLVSGEAGLVVGRGASANTPWVATLVNARGEALLTPLRRDSAQPAHAVAAVLAPSALKVRVSAQAWVLAGA